MTFSPEAEEILNQIANSANPFAYETLNAFNFRRKAVQEVLVRHSKNQIALKEDAMAEVIKRIISAPKKPDRSQAIKPYKEEQAA